jgi:formate hydrogenlyase subunit 3/multisubunit Na+/H+ antiporter MnhD subunit
LLVGELCAFAQSNIKRMLAYSSIGQIGLIIFAVAIATTNSVTGGLFQMVSHTLGKALLFLAVGYMVYRSGSMEISSLEGMGRRMPLTSFAFTIGAFSLVGLPPFIGFPSKLLIVRSALTGQGVLLQILVGLVLVATVIEGAYFFRVIQTVYFKKGEGREARQDAPAVALFSMFVFVVIIVVIGVYPNLITDVLESGASELLERANYIGSVLG